MLDGSDLDLLNALCIRTQDVGFVVMDCFCVIWMSFRPFVFEIQIVCSKKWPYFCSIGLDESDLDLYSRCCLQKEA